MDIQEQAKVMRREGEILLRQDFPINDGFKSIFWVKYQGTEYTIQMLNGVVQHIGPAIE